MIFSRHSFEHLMKRLPPVRLSSREAVPGLAGVENAVRRPDGGSWICLGGDRLNRNLRFQETELQRNLLDRNGKVEPTGDSRIGPVDNTRDLGPNTQLPQGFGQAPGPGGAAYLV